MGAGGGDGDLNLTPMLDLFSTLICFLLLTAAWIQIDALSTNVDNVTSSDTPAPETPEKKAQLMVTLQTAEIRLTEDENASTYPIETDANGNLVLTKIVDKLNEWRQKYPERKDIVLSSQNEVPYKHMISTFDFLVGQWWPDVGVNTQ